jgi:hypothetical protein
MKRALYFLASYQPARTATGCTEDPMIMSGFLNFLEAFMVLQAYENILAILRQLLLL